MWLQLQLAAQYRKQLAATIDGASDAVTIEKGQLIDVSYETLVCSMTGLVTGI
jgi:hypothetical protein